MIYKIFVSKSIHSTLIKNLNKLILMFIKKVSYKYETFVIDVCHILQAGGVLVVHLFKPNILIKQKNVLLTQ
jgi:hypothetical protein